MCGIVGYTGSRSANQLIMASLERMGYRGYDSAGLAITNLDDLQVRKKAGRLEELEKAIAERPLPNGSTGVGHLRWATHGAPTDTNAHPHLGPGGKVAVVHNGIIENYVALRTHVENSGQELVSETDSEVVAFLLEAAMEAGASLSAAMQQVCQQLRGAFAIVATSTAEPEVLVGARRNSSLLVGLSEGENFLGSDVAAFIDHTRDALELVGDQIVTLTPSQVTVTDFMGAPAEAHSIHVDWELASVEKAGFDWFMRKEIFEQPQALRDSLLGRRDVNGMLQLDEMRITEDELRNIDKIIIVGCGSAHYAGLVAKYAIEHWTRIACEVELAHEFRYRDPILTRNTLVVAISQSGETADTLMAVRHARVQRAKVLAICNTNGASMTREAEAVLYTQAGPEVGVASTKGFTTQLMACYLLGLYLAQVRGTKFGDEIAAVLEELAQIPAEVEKVLATATDMYAVAEQLINARVVLFLGRHAGFPVALEGALKLKELTYMHAEGFAAGELKHGPIALVEPGLPVFCIQPPRGRPELHTRMLSGIREIRARGAFTIVIAEEEDEQVGEYADVVLRLPTVPSLLQPLVAVVPLQLFACELATLKGHDVDQPRNLTKAVIVE